MTEIPLFPLNTVLFPSMPIQLHIFEDRYKEMIKRCIDEKITFGVVLIKEGNESMGPVAQPMLIGTTAKIEQVQHLPLGRMNIVAIGEQRFKIKQITQEKTYLVGQVEYLPLETENRNKLNQQVDKLKPLIRRYVQALEQAGKFKFDDSHLPTDPIALSYLSAYLLQTDMAQKQDILEINSAIDLASTLTQMYRREVTLLQVMLSQPKLDDEPPTPFSFN